MLAKWALMVFNVTFWTMGVISLALGLWIYLTMNEYATLSEGKDLLGSAFLVAVGFGIIIVGFLGIIAAVWESIIMTSVFCTLVVLASMVFMTAGIWSVSHGSGTREDIRRELNITAHYYERNDAYRETWDSMQRRFHCCGIEGPTDWRSHLRVSPHVLPHSCCVHDISVNEECPYDDYYTEGCLEDLLDYEMEQYDIMSPFGITFGTFQLLFGLPLSLLFIMIVNTSKDEYSITH